MALSSCNIKNFLTYSQKKAVLLFSQKKPQKIPYISENKNPEKFFIFQETELSYISGNRNPKKMYISGSNF